MIKTAEDQDQVGGVDGECGQRGGQIGRLAIDYLVNAQSESPLLEQNGKIA